MKNDQELHYAPHCPPGGRGRHRGRSAAGFGWRRLAYQGNMERALRQLQGALRSLREATPDKGGHKATAIGLIEQAMGEVQAGIDYAASHFGD